MDHAIIEYFTEQQCSRQWKGFLRAFAGEFAAQLDEADLRALMRRMGARFAQEADVDLGDCRTLEDLQLAMGRVWVNLDWGWVVLADHGEYLEIRHHCAPLVSAFGADALRWSPGFLEGVYQEWFSRADAGELQVRQSAEPDLAGSIEFRLAQAGQ
ncbi:MAG: cellulose biosynthesis protein BcsD [Pseudomonadota bacterium]